MKRTSIYICILAFLALVNTSFAPVNGIRAGGCVKPPQVDGGPRPYPEIC